MSRTKNKATIKPAYSNVKTADNVPQNGFSNYQNFFSEKVKGFDRLKNEMKFDYTDYRTQTIKTYLDMLHGIDQDDMKFHVLLDLMRFLSFEGKATVVKGKPISSLDYKLYKNLHYQLETATLTVTDAILACLFLVQIDSYDGAFFEVLRIFH